MNKIPLCGGSCHQRHLDKQQTTFPPSRKRIVVNVLHGKRVETQTKDREHCVLDFSPI